LWVMGDHRVDSADSRFHCVAGTEAPPVVGQVCDPVSSTVPISRVIGKAVVIVWPVSRWRTLGTPGTFASAAGSAPLVPPSVGVLAAAPLWWYRRRGDA
jgi:signal peptidase I